MEWTKVKLNAKFFKKFWYTHVSSQWLTEKISIKLKMRYVAKYLYHRYWRCNLCDEQSRRYWTSALKIRAASSLITLHHSYFLPQERSQNRAMGSADVEQLVVNTVWMSHYRVANVGVPESLTAVHVRFRAITGNNWITRFSAALGTQRLRFSPKQQCPSRGIWKIWEQYSNTRRKPSI